MSNEAEVIIYYDRRLGDQPLLADTVTMASPCCLASAVSRTSGLTWNCSRLPDHSGQHQATADLKHVSASWEQQ